MAGEPTLTPPTGAATPSVPPDGGATTTPSSADAGGKQASTPTPAAADAAGKTYDEKTFKSVVAERDSAKEAARLAKESAEQAFFQTERGKAVLELERQAAEAKAQAAKAAEAEALRRGEHEKVIAERDKQIADLSAKHAAELKSYRDGACKRELGVMFSAVGALDPNDTQPLIEKALADGTVSMNEQGQIVGARELVAKVVQAKPHWFKNNAAEALKRVTEAAPGIIPASLTTLDTRDQSPPDFSEPTSLARPSKASRTMAGSFVPPK